MHETIIKSIVTVASSIVEKNMKIGELSQKTGCPVTRIRFYEGKGLLPQPKRSLGGQRNYSAETVEVAIYFDMTSQRHEAGVH